MRETVALHVPEELYEALQEQATKKGQKPDALAIEWLTEAVQRAHVMDTDPLVELFGTLESNANDIAKEHDKHIGETLAGKLRNDD
jgi:hypothetical protein